MTTTPPRLRYAAWVPQSPRAFGVLGIAVAVAAVPTLVCLLAMAGSALSCFDSCPHENDFNLFLVLAVLNGLSPFLAVWRHQERKPLPAVLIALVLTADVAAVLYVALSR